MHVRVHVHVRPADVRLCMCMACAQVDRVAHYLDPSSESKIREVAEHELIAKHMRTLAEMEHSGVIAMIEDNKVDDLRRAYDLFKRITTPTPGLKVICDIMAAHVRARGMQLVQDEERDRDAVLYVQGLLALHEKYKTVISAAFCDDKMFYNALNQVCVHLCIVHRHGREDPYLSACDNVVPMTDICST